MTREEAIDILVKRSYALRQELAANEIALVAPMREQRDEEIAKLQLGELKLQAEEPCAE